MKVVRVVLVDDHEIVRAGLKSLLSKEADIHVIAVAAAADEGLRLIEELRPDVAVVDYSLPGMTGTTLCEAIVKRHPAVSVIILTTYLDDHVLRQSVRAGAKAFVYKDVEAKDLKRAIRAVASGEHVLDPKVAGRVMKWANKSVARRLIGASRPLSIRELEVLRLVAKGATNPKIADEMGISVNTVKTYLDRVLSKLECNSRVEAAALASRWGLL